MPSLRPTIKKILRIGASCILRPWLRLSGRSGTWPPAVRPQRLLVICCHWVGDTFWAYQAVRELESHWPETEIHVACKAHAPFLFRDLGDGRVWLCPEITSDRHREEMSWSAAKERALVVGKEGFDAVVDLTGTRMSAWFTIWLHPRWSLGFHGDELAAVYTHHVSDAERPGRHLAERPFRVIAPLVGDRRPPEPLRLPKPRPELSEALRIRRGLSPSSNLFVIAPGAGWPAKQWSQEGFAEVGRRAAKRGRQVLVVGSAREAKLCSKVASGVGESAIDLAGEPLEEVAELLREQPPVLVNDSGLGHLAAASGCPTLTVFTPETSPVHCAPIGPRVRVVEAWRERPDPEEIESWLSATETMRTPVP